jgi:acyl carrier protein
MSVANADMRRIVLESIAFAAEKEASTITDESSLDELGLDSLDLSTILIEIEDRVGAEVPIEILDQLVDIERIACVGDAVSLLSTWNHGAP